MKRYQVHEYLVRGIFAYRPINKMIQGRFSKKNRRGGTIVFPDDVEEKDIDTSFINGNCRVDYLFQGNHTTKDGTRFSEFSLCVDIKDYRSGDMMTTALKYARSQPGKTLLLKDIDDRRLYSICYTPKEKGDLNAAVTRLDEVRASRKRSRVA